MLTDRLHTVFDRAADAIDIIARAYVQTFEISEQRVALGVVGDPLRHSESKQGFLEMHRFVAKNARVHRDRAIDDRFEFHVREDVAFDVDPRRDFHQFHPARRTPEHAALGDVQDRLAFLCRVRAVECDLLDACTNLRLRPSRTIRSSPSSIATSSPPAVNVPAKTIRRAFWLMLMKPPAPASRGPKRLTLTWPSASTSAMPEARHVEPTAIVEIELLVLLNHGVGVDCSSEVETALRHSADDTGLGGQRHVLEYPLLLATARRPRACRCRD